MNSFFEINFTKASSGDILRASLVMMVALFSATSSRLMAESIFSLPAPEFNRKDYFSTNLEGFRVLHGKLTLEQTDLENYEHIDVYETQYGTLVMS